MTDTSLRDTLKHHFGYDEFRPLQEEIIGEVMAGSDTLVIMPTGGGKSLCYQLPALQLSGITLVISPLIALMQDQVDSLRENGVPAAYINSTQKPDEITRIQSTARAGELKILYVAPERLSTQSFQLFLHDLQISLIAVDEAHCISEWGHEFRPDYRNLALLKLQFPDVPLVALTATATPRVQSDIISQLSLRDPRQFVASFDRPNLKLSVVPKQAASARLLKILEPYKGESVIVYCFSRKDTEKVSEILTAAGYAAKPYHAGLSAEQRQRHQSLFINDKIDIIVATIAFGMGIDKPDVRLVVHYTFPKSLEGYYQEIGRAGRDGLPSECVMLYAPGDARKHEFFIDSSDDEHEPAQLRAKLRQIMSYAGSHHCRRHQLLSYFAETVEDKTMTCGNCDNCLETKETFDATELAQKIMSCVVRTGSRFGKGHIVDVLKGKQSEKIKMFGHHELSVYGICRDTTREVLQDVITQLQQRGLLHASDGSYPTLSLTPEGVRFLNERQALHLIKSSIHTPLEEKKQGTKTSLDYDAPLFERLRELRRELAAARDVAPYMIFGDVTLQEMAYYLPTDIDSLRLVQGIGDKKLREFADEFLPVITQYVRKHDLQPRDFSSQRKVQKAAFITQTQNTA